MLDSEKFLKDNGYFMDIRISDLLQMKKKHPCGSDLWEIRRVGMDIKLRCQGCQHEVMLPRSKVEKNIIKILRNGEELVKGEKV